MKHNTVGFCLRRDSFFLLRFVVSQQNLSVFPQTLHKHKGATCGHLLFTQPLPDAAWSLNAAARAAHMWKRKNPGDQGCLPFDRKIRLGCPKHTGKRFTSLPQNCHIRYGLSSKKGRICVQWVWNREGTEKLVNGKQHSVWFVPTGMNKLPQNVLLNFRLEFPKSVLTIYLPSTISEIFFQMVSTPGLRVFNLVFNGRGCGVQQF